MDEKIGMTTRESFKFFHILFQFVGLEPINAAKPESLNFNNFVDNIVNLIPTTLTTIACLAMSYFLLRNPTFHSYGSIHVIMNTATILSLSMIVITGNGQCFFNKSINRNINRQILQIEQKMHEELPSRTQYASAYRFKFFLIIFLYFLSQGLLLYEAAVDASANGMLSSFFTSLFRFMYPVAVLHVVLYGDIVANFMHRINGKITNLSTSSRTCKKVELLKFVKAAHMDLWKVSVLTNRYFGWNLIFVVIYSFMYITYQLYWIFVTVHMQWNVLGVIEAAVSLVYGLTSLYILINSCQSGSLEVKHFAENINQYVPWISDNEDLHSLKVEIFHQVNHLSMEITASDFFCLDRQFFGNIITSCCMYITIFIQFYIAADKKT